MPSTPQSSQPNPDPDEAPDEDIPQPDPDGDAQDADATHPSEVQGTVEPATFEQE